MADQRPPQTTKVSRFLNHLKVLRQGSQSTPPSRSDSPPAVAAPPAVAVPPASPLPPADLAPTVSTIATDPEEAAKPFRILVIGRANAGKTMLLKRVCNTKEDPVYSKVRYCSRPLIPHSYRPFTDRLTQPRR